MSKGKKKPAKLSQQPASKKDVERAHLRGQEEGTLGATAIFLRVLLDKEGYDRAGLIRVWGYIQEYLDAFGTKDVGLQNVIDSLFDENQIGICGGLEEFQQQIRSKKP